jgi:hypothetical protein
VKGPALYDQTSLGQISSTTPAKKLLVGQNTNSSYHRCLGPSQIVPCAPPHGAPIALFRVSSNSQRVRCQCRAWRWTTRHCIQAALQSVRQTSRLLHIRASRRAKRAQAADQYTSATSRWAMVRLLRLSVHTLPAPRAVMPCLSLTPAERSSLLLCG